MVDLGCRKLGVVTYSYLMCKMSNKVRFSHIPLRNKNYFIITVMKMKKKFIVKNDNGWYINDVFVTTEVENPREILGDYILDKLKN